jgi:hypothetical protein
MMCGAGPISAHAFLSRLEWGQLGPVVFYAFSLFVVWGQLVHTHFRGVWSGVSCILCIFIICGVGPICAQTFQGSLEWGKLGLVVFMYFYNLWGGAN